MTEAKSVPQEKVRVTADLPVGTIEILRELATSQQITLTEALRRAIANEGLLRKRVKEDKSRVLLEAKDGKLTELLFRD
jgi:hypothetical protein